jgi:hypothetical protein
MSSLSKLASGELKSLNLFSRNSLIKVAELRKEAFSTQELAAKAVGFIKQHKLQSAAAVGATGASLYDDPTNPLLAGGYGAAAYGFTSPAAWSKIRAASKLPGASPTAFSDSLVDMLKKKAIPPAIMGGLSYTPAILRNVNNFTANTTAITKPYADKSTPLADNTLSWLTSMSDMSKNVSDATKNITKTTEDYLKSPDRKFGINDLDTPTKVLGGVGLAGGGGVLLHHLLKQHEEKKKQQHSV